MIQLVDAAQAFGAVAAILVALSVIGRAILGLYRLAKRVDATHDLVHRELRPNGGSSLRDKVDSIDKKADLAVSRAEDAAHHAGIAAENASRALSRIEHLERGPGATAIVVNPPLPSPSTDPTADGSE